MNPQTLPEKQSDPGAYDEIHCDQFGIDQDGTYTLDEIGRRFDLTRERIRQIEKRALEKLAEADTGDVLRSFLAI